MASQKATVMSGLKQIKGPAAQAVASKLMPEIIHVFRVFDTLEDEDIQVPILLKFLTNRRMLARFLSMFPPKRKKKGGQLFRREQSP